MNSGEGLLKLNKTIKILFTFALSIKGTHAFGASTDTFPTASAYAYGGYSVYKSEMVQSNDTAFTVGYGFEFFAGRERDWGMGLNREAAQLAFALNSAKIAINADIFKITYSLGPVWFGPLFNYTLWDVAAPPDLDANEFIDQNTASEPYLTASSQGVGFHGGVDFYLGKKTLVSLKLAQTSTLSTLQQTPVETSQAGITGTSPTTARLLTIGPRTDMDLGAMILLSRDVLHLLFGFKATTYQIGLENATFAETHNTTYLGFVGTWNF